MSRCSKHPDIDKALRLERQRREDAEARLAKVTAALDRYGQHEAGCYARRTGWRMGACTCGLHARIREGGLKP